MRLQSVKITNARPLRIRTYALMDSRCTNTYKVSEVRKEIEKPLIGVAAGYVER